MEPFLAIHCGAGYHSPENTKIYKLLLQNLCTQGISKLKQGSRSLDVLEYVIKKLEDHPSTNSGIIGSNLTLCGKIEADACVVSELHSASVGACPLASIGGTLGFQIHRYPISIARKLYEQQGEGAAGRQQPIFLAGIGAQEFAKDSGLELLNEDETKSLISQKQIQSYHEHLKILSNALNTKQDTVGVIVLDSYGAIIAGSSSGGISLKHRGRIGPAALPEVGVVIEKMHDKLVAICLSGTGEQIIKTKIGRKLASYVLNTSNLQDDIKDFLSDQFINSESLIGDGDKSIGAMIVTKDGSGIDFSIVHTTPSFCICSASGNRKPKFRLSRLRKGQTISVQSMYIKH